MTPFSSDTNSSELALTHSWGLLPTRWPPSGAGMKAQAVTHLSDWLAGHSPPHGRWCAGMTQGTEENASLVCTGLLDYKGSRGTSRWKGCIGRIVGGVLPCLLWVHYLPRTSTCSPSWKLSKPRALGIFMEAPLGRHDELLTQSPVFLPFLEDGGVGGQFQDANHGLISLVTSRPGTHQDLPP